MAGHVAAARRRGQPASGAGRRRLGVAVGGAEGAHPEPSRWTPTAGTAPGRDRRDGEVEDVASSRRSVISIDSASSPRRFDSSPGAPPAISLRAQVRGRCAGQAVGSAARPGGRGTPRPSGHAERRELVARDVVRVLQHQAAEQQLGVRAQQVHQDAAAQPAQVVQAEDVVRVPRDELVGPGLVAHVLARRRDPLQPRHLAEQAGEVERPSALMSPPALPELDHQVGVEGAGPQVGLVGVVELQLAGGHGRRRPADGASAMTCSAGVESTTATHLSPDWSPSRRNGSSSASRSSSP